MRKLTVSRRKSFVGCLGTSKIFIEDWTLGDTMINGIKCRYIGWLKNGETKSFEIENWELKILVITDKLSKGICSEYYQLPEGEEDIELTGGCKFNPLMGNAFRFDRNDSPDVIQNRRSNSSRTFVALIIILVIGFIIGCFIYRLNEIDIGNEETFSSRGMSITLTDKFSEIDPQKATVAYESDYMIVVAVREEFPRNSGFQNYSKEEYAKRLIPYNDRTGTQVRSLDGMVWIQFDEKNHVDGKMYRCYTYIYKTEDSFWLVQFAILRRTAYKLEPFVEKWAQTVEFE